MRIDPTTTVDGGPLILVDLSPDTISLALSPEPSEAVAVMLGSTVSISRMFVDSGGDLGEVPLSEDEDDFYFGVHSRHFGLGGAPPYIDGYPVGGTMNFKVGKSVPLLQDVYIFQGVSTLYRGFGNYPLGGLYL